MKRHVWSTFRKRMCPQLCPRLRWANFYRSEVEIRSERRVKPPPLSNGTRRVGTQACIGLPFYMTLGRWGDWFRIDNRDNVPAPFD
jgi:hypothetical protein